MNNEISIKELVEKISKITNKKVEIVVDKQRVRPNKSEVDRLLCNNKKLLENSNWKPLYNMDKGLKETIDWLEENKKLFKHDIYNT